MHRGVAEHWDISADLTELGRTPVAVVCAGVKSILDIPKTLEVLETVGAGVITYSGPVDGSGAVAGPDKLDTEFEFPAFFSPRSGVKSPAAMSTLSAIAHTLRTASSMGLKHGHVIAVPPPETVEGAQIEAAIAAALEEAARAGVAGRDVTPFLLRRVNELTGGASLRANVALVKRNAAVAARLAVELAEAAKTVAEETKASKFPPLSPEEFRRMRSQWEAKSGGSAQGPFRILPPAEYFAMRTEWEAMAKTKAKRSTDASAPSQPQVKAQDEAQQQVFFQTRPPRARTAAPWRGQTQTAADGADAAGTASSGFGDGQHRSFHTAASRRSAGSSAAVPSAGSASGSAPVIVLGGAVVDMISRPSPGKPLLPGTSNPGIVTQTFGGVGAHTATAVMQDKQLA